ncbi:MAG: hypothetical protein BRC29_02180 [Nanohaloarchaea archaeon SW_7_43_1]|nr:MAG: hypothetical protein BRC29_02180 [Nanohaloarchaea archaeon SW_7_43_1]
MNDYQDKRISYTSHAKQRIRERFISRKDVEKGILNRKWKEAYGDKQKVIQAINGKEIEIILKPEDDKILVITVYWR